MIEASPKTSVFLRLLVWHYRTASGQILKAWKNFLLFNGRYFSLGLLFRTLFSHWRRYRESYGRGFDPKRYAMVFLGNAVSRALGCFVRVIVILAGLFVEAVVFAVGLVLFLFWLAMPAVIIAGLYAGAALLI